MVIGEFLDTPGLTTTCYTFRIIYLYALCFICCMILYYACIAMIYISEQEDGWMYIRVRKQDSMGN